MHIDWREQGQEKYLSGLEFRKEKYIKYSKSWEHDHCEFCGMKFYETNDASLSTVSIGYTSKDHYRWICEECFEFFQKKYKLKKYN